MLRLCAQGVKFYEIFHLIIFSIIKQHVSLMIYYFLVFIRQWAVIISYESDCRACLSQLEVIKNNYYLYGKICR